MFQYFQEVCSWRLVSHDTPVVLGGAGSIVAIDESLFCHKVKVIQCKIVIIHKLIMIIKYDIVLNN